jgi:mRNA interferase MazF
MYRQGEIVLIPVPFSDLTASKKRPVLVISNDEYNTASQDIIVTAVTSNLVQQGIPITTNDMTQGILPKPSIIRSDKIYTLHQHIVVKRIGRVADSILDTVRADIIKLISNSDADNPA